MLLDSYKILLPIFNSLAPQLFNSSNVNLDIAFSAQQKSTVGFIIKVVRIIGGIYRGRRLQTSNGLDVRPTSDRLRETLFNILAPQIRQARFLDLCAGSGAIGMEALSRHAAAVTFVEQSRRASEVIKANLQTLKIGDEARILNRDVLAAIKQFDEAGETFDLIYFDPPYASDLYAPVLTKLTASHIIHEDSLIIVEHRAKMALESEYGDWKLYRQVKQGESALAFYALAAASSDD